MLTYSHADKTPFLEVFRLVLVTFKRKGSGWLWECVKWTDLHYLTPRDGSKRKLTWGPLRDLNAAVGALGFKCSLPDAYERLAPSA